MIHVVPKPPTLAARSVPRLALAAMAAGALLVPARPTHAGSTPEQTCQKGRYSASAQYSACQQKAWAKFFAGSTVFKLNAMAGKCRAKHTAVWSRLRAKAPGSTCDTARFTDNGTTVTDNLTGLQWEKKTTDATVHDVGNIYSWSATLPFVAADGDAFTTFLPALNSGGCFAGQCDWRLPTINELQTIVLEPYPCSTNPCIDPIFGPTDAAYYWSATIYVTILNEAWGMYFHNGNANFVNTSSGAAVRAVRAGL